MNTEQIDCVGFDEDVDLFGAIDAATNSGGEGSYENVFDTFTLERSKHSEKHFEFHHRNSTPSTSYGTFTPSRASTVG